MYFTQVHIEHTFGRREIEEVEIGQVYYQIGGRGLFTHKSNFCKHINYVQKRFKEATEIISLAFSLLIDH